MYTWRGEVRDIARAPVRAAAMRRIGRFRRTGPEPHLDFGASDRPAEVRPFVAVHGTSAIQGEMTARKRPVSLAAETVYPNRKRRFAGGPFMPQMRAPILITGRGIVSCLGLDVEQMAARILAGEGAIRPVGERLTSQRFTMGAPVDDFVPADHFDTRSVRTLDRFAQYAAVAGRNAWAEAGGAQAGHAPERIGVVVGTASAGIDILDDGFERIFVGGGRPSPLTIPMTMGNAAASRIAREIARAARSSASPAPAPRPARRS
ncbi:beta-ketoacyl synthase N-terminal-like domain-containing protein [Methyloraptor flagellatus]|uniref:Beta-ketoacyl synthase N-terminal-like domain-containing protein n=1 Tax=Methyloraptor flagellatus TaxID=3162530 RepID=A0AAU7XG33_9HYPH